MVTEKGSGVFLVATLAMNGVDIILDVCEFFDEGSLIYGVTRDANSETVFNET